MIALRNALVGNKKKLPYDAEVEWLESTGTQWIDTLLRATPTSKIFIDFVGEDGGNFAVCGASNGSAYNKGEIAIFWRNNIFDLVYPTGRNSSVAEVIGSYVQGNRYIITYKSQQAIINEQTFQTSTWSNEYIADRTFFIGAVNRGTANNYPGRGLYYGFKIWDGDVLDGDFIPVRFTNEQGVAEGAMYDRVSGKLFRNQGTGSFVIGPDIVPVEYLESTGTQWIDTLYKPNAFNFGFDVDITFYNDLASTRTIAGTWGPGSWSNTVPAFGVTGNYRGGYGSSPKNWRGSDANVGSANIVVGERARVSVVNQNDEYNGQFHVKISSPLVNETVLYDNPYQGSSTQSYVIGGTRGRTGAVAELCHCRFYSFRLLEYSTVVRDLVPVRVGMEGAMMDKLTRQTFRNLGTGSFLYGNDIGRFVK